MLEEQLRAVPLFRQLSGERLRAVAALLSLVEHPAGHVIFREGDHADALYLVDTGQVQVGRAGEPLAVLGPGSFVGEIGLLLDEVRTADLVALTPVRLWELRRGGLDQLLRDHGDIALEVSRQLSERLAAATQRLAPRQRAEVVAVWPRDRAWAAGAGWPKLDELMHEISVITGERPALVPAGDAVPDRAAYSVAVLPTEPGRASRSVLRRARYIVCFGEPPEWVTRRHEPSFVLRCDGLMSIDRAARWVTRTAVGLALSSGGSKTVAHLGVLDALRAASVPIDMVAGTSGGAVVAVCLALGQGRERMVRQLRELSELLGVRRWDVNVPPRTGLIKGRRLRDVMDEWFEGKTFADLVLPTVVVATDLASGDEVLIDSGSLADGVRASLSIPGVFDPWVIGGRALIDGAVVNPLAVSVLRDRGAPLVIASNVAGKAELDDGDAAAATNVLQTMMRMISLMERELLKTQTPLADVVIRPRVSANYSFDFSRIDEFIDEGKRAATEALTSVRREQPVLFP